MRFAVAGPHPALRGERFVVRERHDGTRGPAGWPVLWEPLAGDAPEGAEVWTREQRDAWNADPAAPRPVVSLLLL